jgi:hypothetical protein
MKSFLQQHADHVIGQLSGWDRLRFRGTLRLLASLTGLNSFLCYTRHLIKDFAEYAQQFSRQIRTASLEVAEAAGRPVEHLSGPSVHRAGTAGDVTSPSATASLKD